MDLPISVLFSRPATLELVHSAEPDAPVVETREPRARRAPRPRRPHAVRTRTTLAAALHRAAEALAPAEPDARVGRPA